MIKLSYFINSSKNIKECDMITYHILFFLSCPPNKLIIYKTLHKTIKTKKKKVLIWGGSHKKLKKGKKENSFKKLY